MKIDHDVAKEGQKNDFGKDIEQNFAINNSSINESND